MSREQEALVYPLQISGGRVITIHNLPYELSMKDAERISAVILALALPENSAGE